MMKKILFKLAIFVALLMLFDRCYGQLCQYLVSHPSGGAMKLDQYVCDSAKADLLVFGSSKAQNQYDPKILEDTLGMSVFNCGYHGMGVIFHYGRWKIISQRYVPKVIVYEFLPILDMMVRDDNSIYINPLRPYYGKVSGVDSIFWSVDRTERYKMLSKTYQYHSPLEYLSSYSSKDWYRNGYGCPLNTVLNPQTVKYETPIYSIDSLKLHYMERFIREVSSQCQLIMVVSPMYSFHEDYGGLTNLKELCAAYNVPVLDHFCDEEFVDSAQLYVDMAHLNRTGSVKWSKMIASEIKNNIIRNE
jgi:hypothetical protein